MSSETDDALRRVTVHFVVGGQPIPWKRARVNPYGARYPDPLDAQWREEVQLSATTSKVPMFRGDVHLMINFYRKSKHLADIDNLAKAIMEALEGIAYENDRQVSSLDVARGLDRKYPRAEVWIGGVPMTDEEQMEFESRRKK